MVTRRAIFVLLLTLPVVTAGCDAIFGIQDHPLAADAEASLDGSVTGDDGPGTGDAMTDGSVPPCPTCRMGSTTLGSCCLQ
jgi:hypothetical protein